MKRKTPTAVVAAPAPAPETVGRTYTRECWGLHSRRIGGDGKWYGTDSYRTREDIEQVLRDAGARVFHVGGGLAIDFGPDDGLRYERRIVKVTKTYEVTEVFTSRG